MQKKTLFPIVIASLSLAFVIICFLLYFDRNSKRLTAAKFKIGGIIIGLTTLTSSCVTTPRIMCYRMRIPPKFYPIAKHVVSVGVDQKIASLNYLSDIKANYNLQTGSIYKYFTIYGGLELNVVSPDIEYVGSLIGPQLGVKLYSEDDKTIYTDFTVFKGFGDKLTLNPYERFEVKLGTNYNLTHNMWSDFFVGYKIVPDTKLDFSNFTFGIRILFTYDL